MTLKEELEILRGEPIEVFAGDPMDIPCIETSNPERLCKHPVVSVSMITYNHEPYIRQAIEGVMMQKTNFEFELVIGEDASTDKTREICFEYQKKYSDKIRVLWWHENINRVKRHPAGGNSKRNMAHCRGEFIAFCEGDDYWIDPLKLQKQVDVMREYPNVGFCFARARICVEGESETYIWNENSTYRTGVISGREFMLKHLYGVRFDEGGWSAATFLMTASVLFRKSTIEQAVKNFEVLKWRLLLGDTPLWLGLAAVASVYCLQDIVSVYNQRSTGLCKAITPRISVDALIVRMYYHRIYFNRPFNDLPTKMLTNAYWHLVMSNKGKSGVKSFRSYISMLMRQPDLSRVVMSHQFLIMTLLMWVLNQPLQLVVGRFAIYFLNQNADSSWIIDEYAKCGAEYRPGPPHHFFRKLWSGIIARLRRR